MHRVIAESEVRLKVEVTATELQLGAKISETEQRLENRLSDIDQRIAAAQRETTSQSATSGRRPWPRWTGSRTRRSDGHPCLLGWATGEIAQEVFRTAEVARICEILAEGLSDEFVRRLSLPLDTALVTDSGLCALRTLVAGVIVARFPTDDREVDTTSMTANAFIRVAEVIHCCAADRTLESYEPVGAILVEELYLWRFTIAVLQRDNGARLAMPDEECEMLLAMASTGVSSNVPAEKKVAQIRAAIKAAAC
jgi:hypothetical protein